ncbi:unnamed protein product, partial [Notodromas monacha]
LPSLFVLKKHSLWDQKRAAANLHAKPNTASVLKLSVSPTPLMCATLLDHRRPTKCCGDTRLEWGSLWWRHAQLSGLTGLRSNAAVPSITFRLKKHSLWDQKRAAANLHAKPNTASVLKLSVSPTPVLFVFHFFKVLSFNSLRFFRASLKCFLCRDSSAGPQMTITRN